jgi:hypothetical protein
VRTETVGGHNVVHYDAADPADLAVIVANGMVWQAGPKATKAAFDALVAGTLPMNDRVPADIRAAIERAQEGK